MTHFAAWALVTVALLGVAFAFGFVAEWLSGTRERRDARRRAREVRSWRP